MPDSYVLYVWMLIPDVRDGMLQPMWESFFVGFEFCPAALELGLAMHVLCNIHQNRPGSFNNFTTYNRLPIVINDKIRDWECELDICGTKKLHLLLILLSLSMFNAL